MADDQQPRAAGVPVVAKTTIKPYKLKASGDNNDYGVDTLMGLGHGIT